MFNGRTLLIATMHGKEKVIAPLLEKELGVSCVVPKNLNTDILGTFTGEVTRYDDPVSTARKKCLMAIEKCNGDLAVASEGSFGLLSNAFFVPADDEVLLLVDTKNDLEIKAREISTATNFAASDILTEEQLLSFANKIGFPEHGLILRKSKDDFTDLVKGIADWNNLRVNFHHFLKEFGAAYVETDMRAMLNPLRMKVIEKATQKLVTQVFSTCPKCLSPGFSPTESKPGLPCYLCNAPTRSTLSIISTCQKCFYTEEKVFPQNKTTEDPMYCDRCNP